MNTTINPDIFAVIDFETTGLSPDRGDRAIEIGIVLTNRQGQELDSFSSLINPGVSVSSFISSFTGISNRMLSTAPPANEVFPEALAFIGNAQLVAHNASFDKKFWRHEYQQTFYKEDDRNFLCTLMLSRRIFQSFPSHKLGEIARELFIEATNSHRALADSEVTARILSVMLKRLQLEYSGQVIDAKFLHSYQRKSKASLPDLSLELGAI